MSYNRIQQLQINWIIKITFKNIYIASYDQHFDSSFVDGISTYNKHETILDTFYKNICLPSLNLDITSPSLVSLYACSLCFDEVLLFLLDSGARWVCFCIGLFTGDANKFDCIGVAGSTPIKGTWWLVYNNKTAVISCSNTHSAFMMEIHYTPNHFFIYNIFLL